MSTKILTFSCCSFSKSPQHYIVFPTRTCVAPPYKGEQLITWQTWWTPPIYMQPDSWRPNVTDKPHHIFRCLVISEVSRLESQERGTALTDSTYAPRVVAARLSLSLYTEARYDFHAPRYEYFSKRSVILFPVRDWKNRRHRCFDLNHSKTNSHPNPNKLTTIGYNVTSRNRQPRTRVFYWLFSCD